MRTQSTKGRFGAEVVDGSYATMTARLAADNNHNLILMTYDAGARWVKDRIVVPEHFFTPSIIQRRPPLSATARRAGAAVALTITGAPVSCCSVLCYILDGDAALPIVIAPSWLYRDTRWPRRLGTYP